MYILPLRSHSMELRFIFIDAISNSASCGKNVCSIPMYYNISHGKWNWFHYNRTKEAAAAIQKKNKQHFVYVSVSAEYKVIEEFQAQTTTTIGMTAIHHICVAYEVHIRGQRITNEKRKKNHGSKCEQQLFDFKWAHTCKCTPSGFSLPRLRCCCCCCWECISSVVFLCLHHS